MNKLTTGVFVASEQHGKMNFGQGEDTSGELKKHPNEVWLRYSYNTDEPWSKVSLLKGRRLPPSCVVALPEKYPNGHAINSKKLEDLEKMIPFLPPENRQFYLIVCRMILQTTPMTTKLVVYTASVSFCFVTC